MDSTPAHVGACRPLALIATVLAAVMLSGAAAAQGMFDGAVRIGVITPPVEEGNELQAAAWRSAQRGAQMAADEFTFNAEMLAIDFGVLQERARGAEAVVAAADAMVDAGAFGIVGGFDASEGLALAAWSAQRGVPYLNVGASADALRNAQCVKSAYHVEPSAAMYLDALAGWYVRAGFRNWFFVHGADEESEAQLARLERGLRERHFGARTVGRQAVEVVADADLTALARAIQRSNADLLVLLTPAATQLELLRGLDATGVDLEVAGFPYPEAQTRAFYAAARQASTRLGAQHRAAAWEASLDAYGAREINARYRAMYGEPMDAPAWSTYQAIKVLYEAAFFGGGTEADSVFAHLDAPTTVFDIWKGIGASFRPWDHQLRQSLYLVKVAAEPEAGVDGATLVGELPAIYMPGTDPVERLDQLGDLAAASGCRW